MMPSPSDEGETKDVRVWAFPKESKEYKNRLIAAVKHNPIPYIFPLVCYG